ncbi:hypothetical protein LIER_39439 [Lithospermum erythrorhizon]|uniref:Uncharacterized protein n=1 Tax=Lithospermum erythrorhizon TaxID=34254 RepID=A0AAV3QHL9_LITER
MGLKLVNGEWKRTKERDQKETREKMAMGIEGLEDQLSLLTTEVFKSSKRVTRIGEKLIDMDLNSDEEDEESDNIEDEDGESAQDVLGSDENEENNSEDAKTLEKDDDSLESDKEVSKEDTEQSECHSEEPVDKGKDPADNLEEVVEDDSNEVPLVQKWKKLRLNTPAGVPLEQVKEFLLVSSWRNLSKVQPHQNLLLLPKAKGKCVNAKGIHLKFG